jgi:hypothetical protein
MLSMVCRVPAFQLFESYGLAQLNTTVLLPSIIALVEYPRFVLGH